MLTQSRLKEVLEYKPNTGEWIWIKPLANRTPLGSVAGSINREGYRTIVIDKKRYQSSRLACLYMTGNWPSEEMDHIDRNRTNDSWSNLRQASRTENAVNRNTFKNNTSGSKGVYWYDRTKMWMASIGVDSKLIHLGYFHTKEEAVKARLFAEKTYR